MDLKSEDKGLQARIIEITLAATFKVCQGYHVSVVEAIAWPLAEGITDLVISQGYDATKVAPIEVSNFTTFVLWNRILDEIALSIPCVDSLEVVGKAVTRAQRRAFITKFGKEGNS